MKRLILAVVLVTSAVIGIAGPAGASAFANIIQASSFGPSSGSAYTDGEVAPHNFTVVVVAGATTDGGQEIQAPTDTDGESPTGNVWHLAKDVRVSGSVEAAIWYTNVSDTCIASCGDYVVNDNFVANGDGSDYGGITTYVLPGIWEPDTSTGATGYGTALNTGNAITSQSNDIAFAGASAVVAPLGTDSSWTDVGQPVNYPPPSFTLTDWPVASLAKNIPTSGTSVHARFTQSVTNEWSAVVANFEPGAYVVPCATGADLYVGTVAGANSYVAGHPGTCAYDTTP
jgi:hypothetical protein